MNIKEIISAMTLEEKAGICSGLDFWRTKSVERLGLPSIMVSDGPHGLRKQDDKADHVGFNDSIKAVCFPSGSATASSFDVELVKELGVALGVECQAENVSVLLGPAVNIKRSPLCGRNFEYYSEDPFLTATIATNYVNGVQSKNVGTSLKHYLANNQEHRRMSSSSEIDERTLREIYLAAFENVVKDSKPWTVMCSYNRINGVYASESHRFLTEVLRNEWGFEGFVVSDWGAVNNRVNGLSAGLDLEMPSSNGINDQLIVDAVNSGTLSEEILDQAVARIISIVDKFVNNRDENVLWDLEEHHALSRKVSSESMVLLKNEGLLPLNKEDTIAFIGEFARKPRYQGGGSSHINAFKVTSAFEAMSDYKNITFAEGYSTYKDVINEQLVSEALDIAKNASVAVIFAGLPDSFESEGYDRTHMSLPQCQNHLIQEIVKVQPNTVVVLHNGSPVEMPWIHEVKSILEVYLGGQAVGEATVDVLFGDVNPSGKLAETFPIKLQDNPSFLYYLGEKDKVEYREGVFVGYRYYDKKDMSVLFPFGHGLSYTQFDYSNLRLNTKKLVDSDTLEVLVDITNTGKLPGKEAVQLYVAPQNSTIIRPLRELKGFSKIHLLPNETKTVTFTLEKRAFAYFNVDLNDWYVESGNYSIEIGKSSRDIVLVDSIEYVNTTPIKELFTMNSTIGDVLTNPIGMELMKPLLEAFAVLFGGPESDDNTVSENAITTEMQEAMLKYMPLRAIISFSNGKLSIGQLEAMVNELNK